MKANELKVTDLMVGDWVKSFGAPHKVVGIRTDMLEPHIKTNMSDTWYEEGIEDLLEPIPLTPEILEKNGFKRDFELKGCYWRPDCRKYCIVKEIETWYFAFRHMGGGHICISECNYVHQLQHALKLCGIDKEIVV